MSAHSVINVECEAASCTYPDPHDHGFACDKTCRTCAHWTEVYPLSGSEGRPVVPLEREVIKDHHNGGDIGEAVYIDGELASIELDQSFANRVLTGTYKGFRVNQTINN